LIERAYKVGESLGLSVWTEDEVGPFQTIPYEGHSWCPEGQPNRQSHEYVRNGTAKLLTLFHPSDGRVRVKGVTSCTNVVLHPWLQQELSDILADLPAPPQDVDPKTTGNCGNPGVRGWIALRLCQMTCHRCGCCWSWTISRATGPRAWSAG